MSGAVDFPSVSRWQSRIIVAVSSLALRLLKPSFVASLLLLLGLLVRYAALQALLVDQYMRLVVGGCW